VYPQQADTHRFAHDGQVAAHEAARRAALDDKAQDLSEARARAAEFEADEARALADEAAKNVRVKAERDSQV
jgi:hypothetical protein